MPKNTYMAEFYSKDIRVFTRAYANHLKKTLTGPCLDQIGGFIGVLLDAQAKGNTVFFIGNGGSASTASHFATDLNIGLPSGARPLRVLSLTDNNALITAIGNDYGFEYVFAKQLENLAKQGDVVVAISASGNSPNLLRAFDTATQKKMIKVAITGFDGGELKVVSDFSVHFETEVGNYGVSEDAHVILNHIVVCYLSNLLQDAKN